MAFGLSEFFTFFPPAFIGNLWFDSEFIWLGFRAVQGGKGQEIAILFLGLILYLGTRLIQDLFLSFLDTMDRFFF